MHDLGCGPTALGLKPDVTPEASSPNANSQDNHFHHANMTASRPQLLSARRPVPATFGPKIDEVVVRIAELHGVIARTLHNKMTWSYKYFQLRSTLISRYM